MLSSTKINKAADAKSQTVSSVWKKAQQVE